MQKLLEKIKAVGVDTNDPDCFKQSEICKATNSVTIKIRRKGGKRIAELRADSTNFEVFVVRGGKNNPHNWDFNEGFISDREFWRIIYRNELQMKLAAALYEEA